MPQGNQPFREPTTRTQRILRAAWAARTLALGAGCAFLVLALSAQNRAFAGSPIRLFYSVRHAVFGNIGTYSNTIEKKDGVTTVLTQAHFRVRLFGMLLEGQEGKHVEEWNKNRLIYFHGITNKGSSRFEVIGQAKGNKFVIHSTLGTIIAPGSVHPANPWSANILDSHTMMHVDTGKLEKVRISGGQSAPVTIEGKPVPCREYKLTGKTKYWVWLDAAGVPVKFKIADGTGMITFILAHCTNCSLDGRFAAQDPR